MRSTDLRLVAYEAKFFQEPAFLAPNWQYKDLLLMNDRIHTDPQLPVSSVWTQEF